MSNTLRISTCIWDRGDGVSNRMRVMVLRIPTDDGETGLQYDDVTLKFEKNIVIKNLTKIQSGGSFARKIKGGELSAEKGDVK